MSQHAAYHSGDTGHTFQEDEPGQPFLFRHFEASGEFFAGIRVSVSGRLVHSPSEHADSAESNPVGPICSLSVRDGDVSYLGLRVSERVNSCSNRRVPKYLHWMYPG
jgi:uncharacterized membrane-anchored protein